jgi:hypothetical protein
MSSGGTFKIITNDGKQDDIIMAQRLLNQRLEKIQKMKMQNANIQDPTPTIADIEKTHILFVHAQFKPFVTIGNEYQVLVQQKVQLGGQAQFNIPLYGDFFHDMVLHLRLGSVSATNTGDGNRLLKYCDYPGERICKRTEFSINGNVLDYYTNDILPFHRNFQINPNKRVGYDRNMGQQVPLLAKKTTAGGRANIGEESYITNGHQTPKATQEALDLWIKILLWFSMDVKLSIISVAIPHGQRFLTINFANANELLQHVGLDSSEDSPSTNPVPTPDIEVCELYVDHIFVSPEIHAIFIKQIGFNLVRIYRLQTEVLDKAENSIHLNQMKWPIETLYLGARPRVNNNVANSLMLENWHKYTVQTSNSLETGEMDANAFWFDGTAVVASNPATAAELDLGLKRSDNNNLVNLLTAAYGGAYTPTFAEVNAVLIHNGYKPLTNNTAVTIAGNAAILAVIPNGSKLAQWYSSSNSLDTLAFEAHGVELFKKYPIKFYNQYLPSHYGAERVSTPLDTGMAMVPFNLYPGSYQPSGHINISRAREFYLKYTSSWISSSNTADLFVIGIAINFLLVSDGSAVMRYST